MSEFMASVGMPEIVAGLMVVALNAYVLLGGGDFGGGLWDLLASGPRRDAQRTLIADSIAPIWEANHVWLIVVVVVLFTGFPAAFGTLGTILHIPITLLLIGIVLRGSAFVFRSYGSRDRTRRESWGLAFAIASSVTPILLGIIIGAVASGDVGAAARRIGAAPFTQVFVSPWLAPFPIVVGVFALALFAFLAAV
jgi:cytochrome d ubiquinol oxidase subunit II